MSKKAIKQAIIEETIHLLEEQNGGNIPWAGEGDPRCSEVTDINRFGKEERCVLKPGHKGPCFNGVLDGEKGILWMPEGKVFVPKGLDT
jgi:hypothetical protein